MFSEGYIGITNNIKRRFSNHKFRAPNEHFRNAIKKYKNEIIWNDIILIGTKEYCLNIEFKLRPSENIGWNQAIGGNKLPNNNLKGKPSPLKGTTRSQETKDKISKKSKEFWKTISENKKKQMAEKLSKYHTGRKDSEETKQKKITKLKNRPVSLETRNKIGKANKGKKAKAWKIISPENLEFIIIGLQQFCKENQLSSSHITDKNGYKGWKAELINQPSVPLTPE